jgi:ketosteroid isomerase-like protein
MAHHSMKSALGVAALLVAACTSQPQASSTLTDQDVAALRAIAERDAPLVRAHDWAALSAEYADDAVRMPPNGPTVRGRDGVRKMLEQMPPISAFDFRLVDLQGDGRLAYMRGAWSITVTPPGAPTPVSDSGKILVVFRKEPDGTWRRVADAWNSDVPPAR